MGRKPIDPSAKRTAGSLSASRLRALTALLPVVAALAYLLLPGARAGAQPEDSVQLVAIDTNTSGNAAASIGAIDSCNEVGVGGSLTVDVVVDEIPAAASAGFQFTLLYDQNVVHVTKADVEQLLDSGGNRSLRISDGKENEFYRRE